MDKLLADLAVSFLCTATWFEAAGRHAISRRLVNRAGELLGAQAERLAHSDVEVRQSRR